MSFNALSIAKLGIGFGALAVASIGLLSPAQVEAEQYVANPTIVFQQLQPTYALLRSYTTDVTTLAPDVFLLDSQPTSYVLVTLDRAAIRSQEEVVPSHEDEPPVFVLTTLETTPTLQLAKHTPLLHVNKSYTIYQTTARDLWLQSSKP